MKKFKEISQVGKKILILILAIFMTISYTIPLNYIVYAESSSDELNNENEISENIENNENEITDNNKILNDSMDEIKEESLDSNENKSDEKDIKDNTNKDENQKEEIPVEPLKEENSNKNIKKNRSIAQSGNYLLSFKMLGNPDKGDNFYNLQITITSSDETQLTFDPDEEGIPEGNTKWDTKKIRKQLTNPTNIKISCQYKAGSLGLDYEEISFEAPFEEFVNGAYASGTFEIQNPDTEFRFCRYSIECEEDGCPVTYIDADDVIHVQENCRNLTTEAPIEEGGWYAVRESFELDSLFIFPGNDVNLVLCDGARLKVKGGVNILEGSSLTIWCQENKTGTLNTRGYYARNVGTYTDAEVIGPGIYVDETASLTINGGIINARPGVPPEEADDLDKVGSFSSGIGGGSGEGGFNINCGEITINGGTIHSYGGSRAAGIGGGYDRSIGDVGDGGTHGNIIITGGKVYSIAKSGGAGIGSAREADDPAGEIRITGGYVEARGGSYGGAGIGAGERSLNGVINILGGEVYAYSYNEQISSEAERSGTGIGAGAGTDQVGAITITNAKVYAIGGRGAGIGGGGYGPDGTGNGGHAGGTITITNSCVVATSEIGAGIGGGGGQGGFDTGNGGNITINSGTILAVSYHKGAGIGGGNDGDSGTITINDGFVMAVGGHSSVDFFDAFIDAYNSADYFQDPNPDASETYDAGWIVGAVIGGLMGANDWGGAGIGGGDDHDGETITINGGTVIATAGMNTAHAIGHGNNGDSDGNVSVYERSKTTYGNLEEDGSIGPTSIVYGGTAGANAAKNYAYVKIEPGECTVTFDVNGIGIAPENQHPNWGGFANRPEDPTAEGYLFDDWYKDPSRTQKFNFDDPINDNTTIYGKWIKAYPITIQKIWPEGQTITQSIEVEYKNQYSSNKSISDTIELSPNNNWSKEILVTDESYITFKENKISGYINTGWKISYNSTEFDLPKDSDVDKYIIDISTIKTEHNDFINALHNGEVVTYLRNSRIFEGYKSWEDCVPQEYIAIGNGGTEYHLSFRWEDVINHIKLVLQHYNTETSSWETVEEIMIMDDLSATWDYKFETPINNPNEYRIREVIENNTSEGRDGEFILSSNETEKILYDINDPEANGKEPIYEFKHTTNDGQEFTGCFTVEYSWDSENNQFIISNKTITRFSAEKKWDPDNDRTPKPANVQVALQHFETIEGSTEKIWRTVETKNLNRLNNWKVTFDTLGDAKEDPQKLWRIREIDRNENIAEDKAYFIVDSKEIVYNVSYESNGSGHTIITNSGHKFNVEKRWENDNGERLSRVKVALQHLNSNNTWTNVDTTYLSESNNNWHEVLTGWEEGEYRIREMNDMNVVLLDPNDADGDGSIPRLAQKTHVYASIDYDLLTAYDVSYETDSEGNTIVTNTKVGPFGVRKVWDIDGANQFKPESVDVVLLEWYAEIGSAGWRIVEGPITLNKDNNWSASFDFVPEVSDAEWRYKVRELDKNGNIVIDSDEERETNVSYHMPENKERAEIATYDVNNNELTYEPNYDYNSSTGRTTITNKLNNDYISVQKKWIDKDNKTLDNWKPEKIKVKLQHKNNNIWEDVDEVKELTEENNWTSSWLINSSDLSNYRVRELDKDDNIVYNGQDSDAPQDSIKNKVTYSVIDNNDEQKSNDVEFDVTYGLINQQGNTIITNKLQKTELTIEKEWDIDFENKDRPKSIGVVIQSKDKNNDSDDWETSEVIELNEDNNWKKTILVSDTKQEDNNEIELEYRVRELREATALEEFFSNIKESIDGGEESYTEWIDEFRNSEYFNYLPDDIKNAANTSYEDLLEKLNSTRDDLYDDLMELLNISYKPDQRIVLDKSDTNEEDNNDDEDEDKTETNAVIYHVPEYNSAMMGKTVESHTTKYNVEYENDDNKWKITNKAVLEIDNIKRWVGIDVDDEDMPESAWIVLMFKLDEEAMSNATTSGADLTSLSNISEIELPAFKDIPGIPDILVDGGRDPISLISDLTLGVDIDIFSDITIMPKMAIDNVEANEDDSSKDWRTSYVVSKYVEGIPLEYKGAELSSEIIRQIIKYLIHIDLPISYNPFDNYVSIPTKAIKTVAGIEDPGDLIDFEALTGAAKKKAMSLTMEDINNFGWNTLLDDWHLMANVINIKIDTSDDDSISGTKTWQDDEEENRPEWIKIHVKVNNEEIEGSPVQLNKSDFEDTDEWEWSIDTEKDEEVEYTIEEEFPEDYEYKDNYILETHEFDLINKWHNNVPGRITIAGQKIWNDNNNSNNTRPEKITVHLMNGNKKISTVETSKEADWRWIFINIPEKNEQNELIEYTVVEESVPNYEATGGTKEDNYNITNTYIPDIMVPTKVTILNNLTWLLLYLDLFLFIYYFRKKYKNKLKI